MFLCLFLMRRFAFIFAVIGSVVLFLFLVFPRADEFSENSFDGKLVYVKGVVVDERFYFGNKIYVLNSEVEVFCYCSESLVGEMIEVEGTVTIYKGRKQINAEFIRVLSEDETP